MKREEFLRPNVPVTYVLLTFDQAAERGVTREQLLEGIELPTALLTKPDARIPLLQYGHVVARALRLTGDGGLGYDFGLRTGLTAHGFLAFGMISHPTVRDAIEFMQKYFGALRSPGFTSSFFVEGAQAVMDVREAVPYGPLRQYAFEMLLVSRAQLCGQLLPAAEIELWFECTEPEYYARYRHRLPKVRFSMGANQLRFPAQYLDRPLATANAATAQMVVSQCEHEINLLGRKEDLLGRVRNLLHIDRGRYPDLQAMAKKLATSSRTLKRRLNMHGFSFNKLLEEARERDSIRLLLDTNLSMHEIAERIGYTEAANFSRAFRKWTGTTPGVFREKHGLRA